MNEKRKILIAYDGSSCADAALDDLRQAGLAREAEALIVSVAETWLPPPPPSSYEIVEEAREVHVPADLKKVYAKESPAVEEAQALALRAGRRVQSMFPEWEIRTEALYGSPARELITKADEWKPDLIIVGSHGRSPFDRLVLGSVSQKVVTEAHCSVRVARGRVEEPGTPVRIIIGVDGSHGSEAAVREVASRVWPMDSEVRVIIVEDPLTPTIVGRLMPPVAKWIEESNREDRAWVHRIAENALNVLRAVRLNASFSIVEGDPKRVLIEAAEEWGADCIFVGSTGYDSRLARFMLGSVSTAVVARAHCSVEVVRRERASL
ncbi:MAG TPA: universal stress protein [Pyrinomonadaceae bacterium]|nr:universal stress protein [Pyrinomonadaceae bacterium]